MQQRPPVPPKVRSFRTALVLAALLVIVDAFVINQGVASGLVGLSLLLVGVPRAFLPKFAMVRSLRLRNLAVYGMAVVLVFALNAANNRLAKGRADMLVASVKAFHSKYQRYPRSLDQLVPEFIERIPRAKYTLGFGGFTYYSGEHIFLYYTSLPPFGRPTYSFNRNEWRYLD